MRDHSLSCWNTVGRSPRRIVPPMWVREISGMNMTTGSAGSATNSVDLEPAESQRSLEGKEKNRGPGRRMT